MGIALVHKTQAKRYVVTKMHTLCVAVAGALIRLVRGNGDSLAYNLHFAGAHIYYICTYMVYTWMVVGMVGRVRAVCCVGDHTHRTLAASRQKYRTAVLSLEYTTQQLNIACSTYSVHTNTQTSIHTSEQTKRRETREDEKNDATASLALERARSLNVLIKKHKTSWLRPRRVQLSEARGKQWFPQRAKRPNAHARAHDVAYYYVCVYILHMLSLYIIIVSQALARRRLGFGIKFYILYILGMYSSCRHGASRNAQHRNVVDQINYDLILARCRALERYDSGVLVRKGGLPRTGSVGGDRYSIVIRTERVRSNQCCKNQQQRNTHLLLFSFFANIIWPPVG